MIPPLHACLLACAAALAGQGVGHDEHDEHEAALTPYGFPYREWQTRPPTLVDPQPEPARLWLDLPEALLPTAWQHGSSSGILGLVLSHRATWTLPARRELSFGLVTGALELRLSKCPRAVDLALVVLPRASVLQLRFDFLGAP